MGIYNIYIYRTVIVRPALSALVEGGVKYRHLVLVVSNLLVEDMSALHAREQQILQLSHQLR